MQHKRELRSLPAKELRIASARDGTKTLTGYAIVFNVRSVLLGNFVEVVAPEAVRDTLKGSPDIIALNNHDSTLVLGRTSSGTLKLSTDSTGVAFSCSLDTRSTHANDLAIAVERGDIRGCSFGFVTQKNEWTNESNTLVRTLRAIDLKELSICGSPAYPQTSLNIRSCPPELRSLLRSNRNNDEDCDCDCELCEDGQHCEDCDYDEERANNPAFVTRSQLHKMHMRLALAQRK